MDLPEWLAEIGQFLGAFFSHWICLVGGALVGTFQFCYPTLFRREAAPVIGWWIFWGCIAAAIFLSWRDEHHKARSVNPARYVIQSP